MNPSSGSVQCYGLFARRCPRIAGPTHGGTGACRFHGHVRPFPLFAVDGLVRASPRCSRGLVPSASKPLAMTRRSQSLVDGHAARSVLKALFDVWRLRCRHFHIG